jgi:hypothetical protein
MTEHDDSKRQRTDELARSQTAANYRNHAAERTAPTLGKITRHNGIAGQVAYSVVVTYPGEAPSELSFIGSVYGGPIVMVTPNNLGGVFVMGHHRFGTFGPEWVRRFFS